MAQQTGEPHPKLADTFASRVRRWRRERRIPLKQFAGDLGVSISAVSAWEQGKRSPTLNHVETIARLMGIPACHFLCHHHEAGDCPVCGSR